MQGNWNRSKNKLYRDRKGYIALIIAFFSERNFGLLTRDYTLFNKWVKG